MENTKRSLHKTAESGWEALGEIKLPAGPATQRIIAAWLIECTKALNLGAEFTDKITNCALEASACVLEPGRDPTEAVYVVLCIYAPQGMFSKSDGEHTWGFFRIQKIEGGTKESPFPNDSIELYLYPEGH